MRIGFYYRKKVIVDHKIYEHVPIARWLCRRKGARKPKHKTFSLLPFQFIPYHSHALNIILDTVTFYHHNGASLVQTKDFISGIGVNTDLPLENQQIKDFLKLCSHAWLKLKTMVELNQHINQANSGDHSDPVGALLKFIKRYRSPLLTTRKLHASRVEQLALDFFFHYQTGDYFDRHFLFGTASQKIVA